MGTSQKLRDIKVWIKAYTNLTSRISSSFLPTLPLVMRSYFSKDHSHYRHLASVLIKEVSRIILQKASQSLCLESSHAFHPYKSQHTCLKQVVSEFHDTDWYIVGNLSKSLNQCSNSTKLNILHDIVDDPTLMSLIQSWFEEQEAPKGAVGRLPTFILGENKWRRAEGRGTPKGRTSGGREAPPRCFEEAPAARPSALYSLREQSGLRPVPRPYGAAYGRLPGRAPERAPLNSPSGAVGRLPLLRTPIYIPKLSTFKMKQSYASFQALLDNTILHELDECLKGGKQELNEGSRFPNTKCFKKRKELSQLDGLLQSIQLHYVRYSHTFLIGLSGRLATIIKIRDILAQYFQNRLNVKLSDESLQIYASNKNKIPFLGYYVQHSGKTNKIHLLVNMNQVVYSLSDMGFCDRSGKPKPNFRYFQESQYGAIARVSSILRGLASYYDLSELKRRCMTRCSYILTHSLAMMFAAKFKLGTRAKVFALAGRNLQKPLSAVKRKRSLSKL